MKYLALLLFVLSPLALSQNEKPEWESLDLEESQMREMEKERQQYEDREGDLQIQAEEEEIIPLESEDSRNLEHQKPKED